MKQKRTRLNIVATMPPRRHMVGETFSFHTSEVMTWILAQPKVMQYLFDACAHAHLIRFNPGTGMWQGRDYIPPTNPPAPKKLTPEEERLWQF